MIDPAEGAPDGTRWRPLSVTELNESTDLLLRERLGSVWVFGEMSRFTAHRSGHWYFTLKDEGSAIDCAMFRGRNRTVSFDPRDGLQVLALARPGVWVPRGRYQLVAEALEPLGAGAAALALEQLRARLDADGLFDASRKSALPLVPRRIGIVTSTDGAALRDVLRVLRRRFAGVQVLVAPALMQGDRAAGQIVHALGALDARGLDVLLLVRGGGAREDLAPFDDESVVRKIADTATPLVTGIGHEIDTTLADLVADVRAPTPSAAAEIVVREREELRRRVSDGLRALRRASLHAVERGRGRVRELSGSRGLGAIPIRLQRSVLALSEAVTELDRAMSATMRRRRDRLADASRRISPDALRAGVGLRRRRVDSALAHLATTGRARITDARRRLGAAAARLDALSPLSVLDRGYSLVTRETADGPLVDDASLLAADDRLHVRFRKGAADVRVVRSASNPAAAKRQEKH